MAKNQGKQFEEKVREGFEGCANTSVDRIPDQVTKFKGSTNICDFMIYRKPNLYYIECKSIKGNTLSIHSIPKMGKDGKLHGFYGNIRDNQWEGLLEKSHITGVVAGVMCWWIDKDITAFLPIQFLVTAREKGFVSVPSDFWDTWVLDDYKELPIKIDGIKKRVYYEYDMQPFLDLTRRVNR